MCQPEPMVVETQQQQQPQQPEGVYRHIYRCLALGTYPKSHRILMTEIMSDPTPPTQISAYPIFQTLSHFNPTSPIGGEYLNLSGVSPFV